MFRTYHNGNRKFTKIVATISGESCTPELIEKLYRHGMDVVRMNSAHMTVDEMKKIIDCARQVSPGIAVMLDTKGPNIRSCNVPPSGISIERGQIVRISGDPQSSPDIEVNYPPFAEEVPDGARIVCDDGAAGFLVKGRKDGALLAETLFDCMVFNKKSINVPDVSLKAPALTDKDREFLKAAVQLKCDLIAHSFVRNAEDVHEVRRALGKAGAEIGIIAKIENREGVRNIKEILKAADGIMVARGDLGIEIPLEEVPAIQKKLIYESRLAAKPVITATQMLQSMENSPAPTRAEVSDVANAVYDSTDAVMLSGETAHGKFPCEAVDMMCRIVLEAEKAPDHFFPQFPNAPQDFEEPAYLLASAIDAANYLPIKAILCGTLQGKSAQVCAALRPKVPVYATTPSETVARKLALSYGIFPVHCSFNADPIDQVAQQLPLLTEPSTGLKPDDLIVILSKHSHRVRRNNMLCLTRIKDLEK